MVLKYCVRKAVLHLIHVLFLLQRASVGGGTDDSVSPSLARGDAIEPTQRALTFDSQQGAASAPNVDLDDALYIMRKDEVDRSLQRNVVPSEANFLSPPRAEVVDLTTDSPQSGSSFAAARLFPVVSDVNLMKPPPDYNRVVTPRAQQQQHFLSQQSTSSVASTSMPTLLRVVNVGSTSQFQDMHPVLNPGQAVFDQSRQSSRVERPLHAASNMQPNEQRLLMTLLQQVRHADDDKSHLQGLLNASSSFGSST